LRHFELRVAPGEATRFGRAHAGKRQELAHQQRGRMLDDDRPPYEVCMRLEESREREQCQGLRWGGKAQPARRRRHQPEIAVARREQHFESERARVRGHAGEPTVFERRGEAMHDLAVEQLLPAELAEALRIADGQAQREPLEPAALVPKTCCATRQLDWKANLRERQRHVLDGERRHREALRELDAELAARHHQAELRTILPRLTPYGAATARLRGHAQGQL
jgi:hypothetical protein